MSEHEPRDPRTMTLQERKALLDLEAARLGLVQRISVVASPAGAALILEHREEWLDLFALGRPS